MSDTPPSVHIPQPVAKLFAAWSGVGAAEVLDRVGITTWGDAAAAAATLYSAILIIEWLLKRVLQPLYQRYRAFRDAKVPPKPDAAQEQRDES